MLGIPYTNMQAANQVFQVMRADQERELEHEHLLVMRARQAYTHMQSTECSRDSSSSRVCVSFTGRTPTRVWPVKLSMS